MTKNPVQQSRLIADHAERNTLIDSIMSIEVPTYRATTVQVSSVPDLATWVGTLRDATVEAFRFVSSKHDCAHVVAQGTVTKDCDVRVVAVVMGETGERLVSVLGLSEEWTPVDLDAVIAALIPTPAAA